MVKVYNHRLSSSEAITAVAMEAVGATMVPCDGHIRVEGEEARLPLQAYFFRVYFFVKSEKTLLEK